MSLTAFGVIPMWVIRAGRIQDAYGQDVPDWENTEELQTTGWFQPSGGAASAGGTETLIDRDEQRYDGIAWLRPGTPINGRDRLAFRGEVYEVIGPPARRLSPWSTQENHVRVTLQRLTGPHDVNWTGWDSGLRWDGGRTWDQAESAETLPSGNGGTDGEG